MTAPTIPPRLREADASPDSAGWPGLLLAVDPAPDALLPCFPLARLHVHARLDGLTAHVETAQTFVNTLGRPAEATYVFPLPDRLSVTRFQLETGGRLVEGELRERKPSRPDGAVGVRDSPVSAISEEGRPPVFTVRVGAILPGEEVTVRLTLVGALPVTEGEVEFRFPLTVSPRYIPGAVNMSAPDQELDGPRSDPTDRLSPLPWRNDVPDLWIVVDIDPNGLEAAEIRASLAAVVEGGAGNGVCRVSVRPDAVPDRDFILRYRIGETPPRAALQLLPDGPDAAEGTFALTVVPPPGGRAGRPRDVVFVLDRSVGMGDWKLVAARRAVAGMVESLGPRDRFAVLAFDEQVVTPPRFSGARLVTADGPHRAHAAEFLASLTVRPNPSATAAAIDLAAALLASADPERERVLVLVTGERVEDEERLLRVWIGRACGARVFGLGVSADAGVFLRRLANLSGGACELAESADRLAEAADRLRLRFAPPAVAGLTLTANDWEIIPDTMTPARLPDLYAGTAICIRGRYRGRVASSVTLTAMTADGRPWGVTVPARISDNPAIATAWARGYIRQLEDRYAIRSTDRPALEKRILAVSLQFGVASRFTAFVAVERPVGKPNRDRLGSMLKRESNSTHASSSGPRPPRGRFPIAQHASDDEPITGYVLVEFLGRGQFGEVWKARDKVSGKLVAIKIIDLTFSPTALRDTRRLTILENLNHPHLIPIIASRLKNASGRELDLSQAEQARQRGELKELVFAMGLGEKSLAARLHELNPDDPPPEHRRGLPIPELIRYMRGAAKGIDYLNLPDHGLGEGDGPIVHCGVKPSDLLIVAGEVQLTDAGFARILTPDARYTRVTGAPSHSAPELTANQPGPRTDQYSLAITYYELRTGRLPFPADASIEQVIMAHALGELDFSAPQLTDEERSILRRATAREPYDRFESCEEFIEELVALPEIWAQLRAKRSSSKSDEIVIVQEPPAPVMNEARQTQTWNLLTPVQPTDQTTEPQPPSASQPPLPAIQMTKVEGQFASGEFDLDDPRASAPWLLSPAEAGPPPEPPAASPPLDHTWDASTATFHPDQRPGPEIPAETPLPLPLSETPPLDLPPEPDPEIVAIIRGASHPEIADPPADIHSPVADPTPQPDPDILAIIRGSAPQDTPPTPPQPPAPSPPPPPPVVERTHPHTRPLGLSSEDSGEQTRSLAAPPPAAKTTDPPQPVPPAASPPRQPPPAPPVPQADPPKAEPPVSFASGRRSIGMPVDPGDPLGKRYATAEPDTMIRGIIAAAQSKENPSRPIPPPEAVSPPPPPPPSPPRKKPSSQADAGRTTVLSEEELQRIFAEAEARKQADPHRGAVRPPAAPASPPKPPLAPPPAAPKPKALPPPAPVAKKPAPPPPASESSDDSPSKPEWYREAIREQRQASRQQVKASRQSGTTSSWKSSPVPRPPLWPWVLAVILLLVLLIGAMILATQR